MIRKRLEPNVIDQISSNYIHTKATTIAARMTRIRRIYADFALPATKFFLPRRNQDTKQAESKMVSSWLCVFVANLIPIAPKA